MSFGESMFRESVCLFRCAWSLAAILVVLVASPAHAVVFDVNSTADGPAGSCDVGPGDCTLREAIETANSNANPGVRDEITFSVAGTIQLTEGQLAITEDLAIDGPGAAALTIRAGSPDPDTICQRVFKIFKLFNGQPDFDVKISGLTLTGGDVRDGCGAGSDDDDGGGAIYKTSRFEFYKTGVLQITGCHVLDNKADGTDDGGGGLLIFGGGDLATVRGPDCVIRGNSADDSDDGGGGVYTDVCGFQGMLIDDCLIEENHADRSGEGGGGLFNGCYVDIRNSKIRNNHADDVPDGGGGGINDSHGPIYISDTEISGNHANFTQGQDPFETGGGGFYSDSGPVYFDRVSIHDNQSNGTSGGGGIFVQSAGTVVLNNTTVSGNAAEGVEDGGGGVFNSEAEMFLVNTTITNNRTTPSDPLNPLSGTGGGLRENNSGETRVSNTIIAGNFARGMDDGPTSDCLTEDGDFITLGYNLFGTGTGCRKFGQSCGGDYECDNGRACDGTETCVGGTCTPGTDLCATAAAPSCRESDDSCFFCTQDSDCDGNAPCDTGSGECGCAFDSQCDDGNPGNGREDCNAGSCVAGTPECLPGEVYDVGLDECFDDALPDKMTDDITTVLGPLGSNGGPTQTHALTSGSLAIDCGDPEGCTPFVEPSSDEWRLDSGRAAFENTDYSGVKLFEVLWDDDTFSYEYVILNDPTSTASITEVKLEFHPDCTIDDWRMTWSGTDAEPDSVTVASDSVTWSFTTDPIGPGERSQELWIETLCGPGDSTFRFDGGSGFDSEATCPGPQDSDPQNRVDQRSEIRPFDGDDSGTAVCDIGAFEFQPSGGFTFSVPRTHHGIFSDGVKPLHHNAAHRFDLDAETVTTRFPFVPSPTHLPIVDGLDLYGGNLLFSVDRAWVALHTGGVIQMFGQGIYEVDAAGTVSKKFLFDDYGVHISGLDAFDVLSDDSFLFSVDRVQVAIVAGSVRLLYPGIVYRFTTGPVGLFEWFRAPGLADLDAFDALGDGSVVFSTRGPAFVWAGGQVFHLYDAWLYKCDPSDCVPEVFFNPVEYYIQGMDALAVDETDP